MFMLCTEKNVLAFTKRFYTIGKKKGKIINRIILLNRELFMMMTFYKFIWKYLRVVKLMFFIVCVLNFSGCGTWHERVDGYASNKTKPYCTTKLDVQVITFTIGLHDERFTPVVFVLCLISLPFDFAADTVILPYDMAASHFVCKLRWS
jgi:uncharacterized protein YceK